MNDFLEKHGYFLEKKNNQVIIHHKAANYGCIHILFIFFLIPTVFLTFIIPAMALALIPLLFFYFMEVDKRKKHANFTILDLSERKISIVKKKKNLEEYFFKDANSVIITSEHIGGYASANRDTTEEYRREINVIFETGEVLTLFSIVSDFEDQEPEVDQLISWLEKLLNINVS